MLYPEDRGDIFLPNFIAVRTSKLIILMLFILFDTQDVIIA
jgi:hypothetical protein